MPHYSSRGLFTSLAVAAMLLLTGCGTHPIAPNTGLANANANANSNSNSLSNSSNSNSVSTSIDTKEPDAYEATVTLKFEAVGGQQTTALPTLNARVSRSG